MFLKVNLQKKVKHNKIPLLKSKTFFNAVKNQNKKAKLLELNKKIKFYTIF